MLSDLLCFLPEQHTCDEVYRYGNTDSGEYILYGPNNYMYKVFCQFDSTSMRGYVFLSRDAIALQDRFPVNFSDLHSNSSHIVLRVFESDGGQSQLRIDPLDAYASDKMVFMLNNHAGFASPTGLPELGPYLFVGVPGPSRYPYHHDHIETESGFKANGMNYSRLCINTHAVPSVRPVP